MWTDVVSTFGWLGHRGQDAPGVRPVERQWEERHRPAEVSAIATARGLGENAEPGGDEWTVEKRAERACIAKCGTAGDVAAVQRHSRVPNGQHCGARNAAEVRPYDASAI